IGRMNDDGGNSWGWLGSREALVPFILIVAAVIVYWRADIDPNYFVVLAIGAVVGSTELMSRYRDAPFLPLLSLPGIVYIVLNGGAAILAYYLLGVVAPEQFGGDAQKTQVYRVLLSSLGAMTIFRSGLFTL